MYVGLFITYFTIISNVLVASVLSWEAYAGLRGKEVGQGFERIRALATFCIITTGVTYAFFLRGPGGEGAVQDSIPWINIVFHYIVPLVMTFDWIAFPTKRPTHWHSIVWWIAFTILYLFYVEVLGLLTHTYPYFFLDPTKLGGYRGVLGASVGFVPYFLVFGAAVVFSNHLRLRRKTYQQVVKF
jgi:hypothetical protein